MKVERFIILLISMMFMISCNSKELEKLQQESNNLKNKLIDLEKTSKTQIDEISKLKESLEKYENSPDKLFEKAVQQLNEKQFEESIKVFEKIIDWYPQTYEAEKARQKISYIENYKKKLSSLNYFEYELKHKFAGSTSAELKSISFDNNNLIITAYHSRCDYYDTIFIDIGVAAHHCGNMSEIPFDLMILKLTCQDNTKSYFVSRRDLFRYINMTFNDGQFMESISKYY